MKKAVVGIDVGGTNVKLGLVQPSGKIISRTNLITKLFKRNKEELIKAILQAITDMLQKNNYKKAEIAGIGVGLPGLINPQRGIVHFLPNIPGWRQVPLKKIMESRLRIPTYIENDAKLNTLGEWKLGAGIGVENLVCITLGTGIGSGLILNNALYRGEGFVAGELGHVPLNEQGPKCNCGGVGCFERYVGNTYLLEKAVKIFENQNITLEEIYKLASQGDQRALKFWEDTATHIGNGLVGVVNLLNPRLIIVGGGVSHNHKFLFPTMRKIIKNRAMSVQASMVKIVRANLATDAGILGAQVLVQNGLRAH